MEARGVLLSEYLLLFDGADAITEIELSVRQRRRQWTVPGLEPFRAISGRIEISPNTLAERG